MLKLLLSGRDTVNIETVVNGLKSKEMDLKANKPSQNQHEVNSVRGRSKFRNSRYNNRSKSRSKSMDIGINLDLERTLIMMTKPERDVVITVV